MVEIVSSPNLEEWTIDVDCYVCTSVLRIKADDVRLGRFNTAYWAGYDGDLIYYVHCPLCESDIQLTSDRHPKYTIPHLALKRAKDLRASEESS